MLTIPSSLQANIKLRTPNGTHANLTKVDQYQYLGGRIPSVREDILHRKRLAWAAFRSVRVFLQSEALSDQLKGRLFKALIESVLLYNAETWTLTDTLEAQVDSIYCSLLRAVFRLHYPDLTPNRIILKRAQLALPSATLKTRRLKLVGHVIRARSYCQEPLQKVLFLKLPGPYRRGHARNLRFVDNIFRDANAPDQINSVAFVEALATNRTI